MKRCQRLDESSILFTCSNLIIGTTMDIDKDKAAQIYEQCKDLSEEELFQLLAETIEKENPELYKKLSEIVDEDTTE